MLHITRSLRRLLVVRPLVGSLLVVLSTTLRGDEFQDLVDSFGTTQNVAGVFHKTTTNPDGTGINFWTQNSEGAPAVATGLSNPHMAAADAFGNVYIADKASHAVLKVTPDGGIHTFAGTHVAGFNGDGPAPATSLQIFSPNGIFVIPDGTVYLLDPGNHRIRRVTPDGLMTTVVNDPEPRWYPSGRGLWVSPDRQLIYYTHEFAPVPPSILADGAVVKRWTAAQGIETVCSRDVGFRNPANLAVNPVDGKLYVTDRAEEDSTKAATGLFRIDGPDQRTRISGDVAQLPPADGQLIGESFLDQPRGLAFRADGSYFICGHRDGNIWFVDTTGALHLYISGAGKKDSYSLFDGLHPPLTGLIYLSQPRAVTLAPNGDLLVVCNDSGYVFRVASVAPSPAVTNLRLNLTAPGGVGLSWTGVFGRGYRVERSDGLGTADWQIIGASGGPAASLIDPAGTSGAQAFYRLLPSL